MSGGELGVTELISGDRRACPTRDVDIGVGFAQGFPSCAGCSVVLDERPVQTAAVTRAAVERHPLRTPAAVGLGKRRHARQENMSEYRTVGPWRCSVSPMTRNQVVDIRSTGSAPADTTSRTVVVDAPTLLEGMPELWRILVAIERCRMSPAEVERGPWVGVGHTLAEGHDKRTCPACTGYACGVTVTRASHIDPRLVCAIPDDSVLPGTIFTEYLR
jgi:hypothetical protein